MLKTIDPLLNGQLLAILDDMGHGDEIVVADANFPSASNARRLVDLPGTTAPALLDAILSLLPLDDFVESPMAVMQAPPETRPLYDGYQASADRAEGRSIAITEMPIPEFYARTRTAYAVVRSGERRLYANFLLRKGVIYP
ncbi:MULTISPECIES: RbsD/FucU domain-containing protein [Methylobacterium]|jgi:L-fucose mutarotase|uniref:Ribose ABC transporter n=1 Tax=Methylobacterium aquaticum TaxID=270351 RepID=A0A0C6FH13_9HYPH|nr:MULTISPECIES: RbsD/FucU domain-containing protein [Methylobacterium]MBK3398806.1 ribose ABC transporter [Methylobacterium ajmalii]MBK3407746.1 ribose ABC transporter [Methylobacterium ajmalii]MBK3422868.1 ribose ABC transporter [Methylobacterium ajmalii]MBZ6415460.1 ribose ABC transporter [Methylobacterium sp.]SFF69024.1 L-fucose mutarotase [Methylobacterium sp. yr596]